MNNKDRTEFGFHRTVSANAEDVLCCKYMPSYLVPSDISRLCDRFGCNPLQLAKSHLLASPGAEISKDGVRQRLRTLVPDRNSVGHCEFLHDGKCAIHGDSPYGCAFFDSEMSDQEASLRTSAGLQAIWDAWQDEDSDYALLWDLLFLMGRRAPDPYECKRKIREELRKL